MKTNLLSAALPLVTGALLILSPLSSLAQDAEEAKAMAEAMAQYEKLIAPGPEHKMMMTLAGSWKAKQTLWMAPGAPALESDGTATFRKLMGGRYLLQIYKSEIPGMGKFEGRGTSAFDKATGEFINTWLDSMSTGIMVSKGKATDDKTVSMIGESMDPMSKAVVKFRTVTKYISKDRHEMEMYEQKPGGEERKLMQIVYTRVADAGDSESGSEKKKEK